MSESSPIPSVVRGWTFLGLVLAYGVAWSLHVNLLASPGAQTSATAAATVSMIAAGFLGGGLWTLLRRGWWPPRSLTRPMVAHVLAALPFTILWMGVSDWAVSLLGLGGAPVDWGGPGFGSRLTLGLWLYGAMVGAAHSVGAVRHLARAEQRAERAELAATRARLEALQARLHPHMLFNALNTVANLIHEDAASAERAVETLARLLRRVLDERRHEVRLAEEWELVSEYLALEQLRFGERVCVVNRIAPATRDCLVPPFLVQGLIENAIRHGIGDTLEVGRVTVFSERRGSSLILVVEDDGAGVEDGAWDAADGLGIGLIRERLEAAYPGRAALEIRSAPGAGFRATLWLPHRVAPPTASVTAP